VGSARSHFGPFLIDVSERVLQRDGQPVPLTPKAFDLLAALLERPGRLVSKDELLQKVWPDTFVEESNLAYNVFALRKALGDTAENSHYIETVPKKGYRLTATVTPVSTPALLDDPPLEAGPAPGQVPARAFVRPRRWAWGAALPILGLVFYFATQSRWGSSETEPPPHAVPLTSLPGVVRAPSLSPDGSYVAFSWNGPKQDNPDIYVHQIGGSSPPFRLTSDPSNDHSPSWSPDGRTVVFLRRGPAGGKSEVWRIAPLGGRERKVAEIQPRLAPFRPVSLEWCPDSTCLFVTDTLGAGKPDALFSMSVETGEKRQLTHPQGLVMDADPAVSPDGGSLIFRRDATPFSGEFYRLSLNGRSDAEDEPIRLTSTLYAGKPAWIPDTREILFSASGGLWRLDTSQVSAPRRLPFVGQDGMAPVVSRAPGGGRRLVYVRSFADTNVWRVDTAQPGAPAVSPAVAAIASTRSDAVPSLSPDGHRVVIISNRSADSEF